MSNIKDTNNLNNSSTYLVNSVDSSDSTDSINSVLVESDSDSDHSTNSINSTKLNSFSDEQTFNKELIKTLENWENEFYSHYNDAYRFYLNNYPPMIFMHHFLEKIIKTIECSAGYIASIIEVNNKIFTNIEAVYKDRLCDDSALFHSWQISLDSNSICVNSLKSESSIIVNNLDPNILYDEPIHPPPYCTSYICVPYKFNDKVIGILGLFRKTHTPIECTGVLKVLGSLIGTLQNSYFKVKMSSGYSDKKIITYQLLEDILNTVHDGILIVDESYEIVHTNAYSTQLFTDLYPNSKNIDQNLLKIFPQLDQLNYDRGIKKIFKNKKTDITIDDNKVVRNLEFVFNTVVCGGHFYHLVTIHNVINKNVKSVGLNTKCLMAFLSHELRNPLQSITLANHLIKSGMKNSEIAKYVPQKLVSYFEIINKSCQNMKKIINDVLDLSRIESNEFVIDMEICDIEPLIDSIIEDNLHDASLKGLELEKNIMIGTPLSIFTDSTRITQILGNLVTNAIKYSNSGKIIINVSRDNDSNIKFSVIDQGTGIGDNEMSKLFKAYGKTVSSKTTVNSQGLGLCISQKIANLMGGKITVKSEPQKGSTFSFYHPIKLGMSGCKYETNSTIGSLSGNILLVDDNHDNLSLLHTLLDQFNYEYVWVIKIESVDSGDKAIELCKINNYDIIFMDINMPGISGSSACKIIKSNGFVGKIIATTGNILSHCENKDLQSEHKLDKSNDSYSYFDDIIIKPFDDQVVIQKLRSFLCCS